MPKSEFSADTYPDPMTAGRTQIVCKVSREEHARLLRLWAARKAVQSSSDKSE